LRRIPHYYIEVECGLCGKKFHLVPSAYRSRMKLAKRGKLYCGKECSFESNVKRSWELAIEEYGSRE